MAALMAVQLAVLTAQWWVENSVGNLVAETVVLTVAHWAESKVGVMAATKAVKTADSRAVW